MSLPRNFPVKLLLCIISACLIFWLCTACDHTMIMRLLPNVSGEMIECRKHIAVGIPTLEWRSESGQIDKCKHPNATIPAGTFCTKLDYNKDIAYLKFGEIVSGQSDGMYYCVSHNIYGDKLVRCYNLTLIETTPSSASYSTGMCKVCLPARLPVCPSVRPSVRPSVCLSVCLSVDLSKRSK